MAPQTQRIPLLPFDQDTLDNAFTLRPGSFPEDSNVIIKYIFIIDPKKKIFL